MMKIYILALVCFALVQAKDFTVKEKGEACLLLRLNGTVNLTAAGESVELDFDKAEEINSSTCTLIILNLTESVQVWFQFIEVSEKWQVTPGANFIPHDVFGDKVNVTDRVNYTANSFEDHFRKNESYLCNSPSTLTFKGSDEKKQNITVVAHIYDFQIQSVKNESHFAPAESCKEDNTTTPAPTTHAPTTPATTTAHTTVTPSPQPSFDQNFSCSSDNVTRFRVLGAFTLDITYNTTEHKPQTVHLKVPAAEENTNCTLKSNETLIFTFFGNWSIEYIFKNDSAEKYHVSDITVTYVHDPHYLPNTTQPGYVSRASYSKQGYLEASTRGYYTCKARTTLEINKEVTLVTESFTYKAFNDKGDITFKSGDVTECSNDDDSSSVVPIAVGAALAGLVVIVLIAYLIGRRRSRKAGYESV